MKQPKKAMLSTSSTRMNPTVTQAAALFVAACWGTATVEAATVNWISAAADNYTNRTAWSSGSLPLAADTALVGNATLLSGSVLYTNIPPDAAATNALTSLVLGNVANSSGTFTMNAGTLSITNTGTTALILGNGNPSTGNFTMNGGVLNVVRNSSTFFQDSFQPGVAANSEGTFTLNGGTATFLCGIEIGISGKGTINVTGGTFIDNGWFGLGRGNSATSPGWGIFNLSGGSAYLLRNPGTDGGANGISFCQQGTNGTVNISGGSLYCNAFRFSTGPGAGRTSWETLNVSGGDIYLGAGGVLSANGAGEHIVSVNLSGGTFRSVNMGANTGGTLGLASIGPDGTNWTWSAAVPATLDITPGPGKVTFAPSAGKSITLNNVFSGSGGLVMAGPGTLVINGANDYTGTTTVNGGTVAGTGSVQGSVTVNPGVIIAPGSPTVPGTLTLGNSLSMNGATNIIKLSADPFSIGGVNDLLVVNGELTLQNVSTIKVVPLGPLSSALPYTIAQYSGTPLTSAAVSHLQVVSDSGRYSFSVVDPATTYPYIQVSVSGNSANLVWRGGKAPDPNAWDHVTTNWFNSVTSGFEVFYSGDAVTFDDTAVANLVNIVGPEGPSMLTMSNNAVDYTFAGSGFLSGPLNMEGSGSLTLAMSTPPSFTSITANSGTLVYNVQGVPSYTNSAAMTDNGSGQGRLVKAGTNTLVLEADNSAYMGTIVVTNGVLQYANAQSLGSVYSPLYVTNNGSLDLNGVVSGAKSLIISGSGYNGKGAVMNSSSTALVNNNGVNSLTLAGDASIGAVNRWDIYINAFNGNGFTLTEVGPGSNIFADSGETSLGDIHIVAGRLGFQGNITMGDPTKTVTVESNATLTFFSANNFANPNNGQHKTMVLKGGAVLDSGGSVNNFNGPVFLTGTNLIATRSGLHLWGDIHNTNGVGGLILGTGAIGASSGDLWLEGVNTYSGPTIISNRTLFVGAGSSLGSSSLIQVNSGAKLDVSAHPTFSLGSGRALIGNGTVSGNSIVFGSGATLAVGFPTTNTFTLTVNGDLGFQAGSTNVVKVNKTTSVANDTVTGLNSVKLGGTLVVTNVGANPLAAGDAIPLFSAGAYDLNGFSTNNIIPTTPGVGLAWDTSTLGTDGTLRVISSSSVNPTPTNIVSSVNGNQLELQWPQDHTGWTLQAQTNALTVGLSNNWATVPGSTATNRVILPIVPGNPTVFFRLILNP